MSNMGVGLDIGTMNIISARKNDEGELIVKRVRDAFLDLEPEAKRMLKLSGVNYIECQDKIIIVGDTALHTANIFKKDARRPLLKGIISPKEMDAIEILSIIIKQVLGKPLKEGEICYFSVPAEPIDDLARDVIYHTNVFKKIISELGFEPRESNEALSVVFSECAQEGFSGIGMSFGSGMVNVAMAYHSMLSMAFSISRSGDWIDSQAGQALGMTASKMCTIKEKGIDLSSPKNRNEEAISIYYKALIDDSVKYLVEKINGLGDLDFPEPIPVVLAGGTSQIKGFSKMFSNVFDSYRSKLNIDVGDIRMAVSPLTCISEGLLLQALQEYED